MIFQTELLFDQFCLHLVLMALKMTREEIYLDKCAALLKTHCMQSPLVHLIRKKKSHCVIASLLFGFDSVALR